MEKIRSFIAFPINPGLREDLKRILQFLRENCPGVKWVKPENIHLTLKFLGNVESEKLSKIKGILEKLAKNHFPLEFQVGGLGAFPNLKKPRVIWVGMKMQKGNLDNLVQDIEDNLAELGFKQEKRRFTPHLTLGRVKKTTPMLELTSVFQRAQAESLGCLKINVLLLMKSILTPQGSIYEVISEHKLGWPIFATKAPRHKG